MSDQTIYKKIEELPPEARKQAQDFVDFLYQQYAEGNSIKESSIESIADSPIFGMWKDREDMKDSTKWVKDLRKAQWPNGDA